MGVSARISDVLTVSRFELILVEYLAIDDAGLQLQVGEGEPQVLAVDTVIVCAGQEPLRGLEEPLLAAGQSVHLIGGADVAAELDAKRAIDQGSRLAASL